MIVLGVDPGTIRMGLGVIDSSNGDLSLVYMDALTPDKTKSLAERLHYLHDQLLKIVRKWNPEAVAIENPFMSQNAKSAIAIGQAQSLAMVAAVHHGADVYTYAPMEIKRAVTDYGGSSKEQVQEMVQVLLNMEHLPEPLDASDALAVAICHVNASRLRDLTGLD